MRMQERHHEWPPDKQWRCHFMYAIPSFAAALPPLPSPSPTPRAALYGAAVLVGPWDPEPKAVLNSVLQGRMTNGPRLDSRASR